MDYEKRFRRDVVLLIAANIIWELGYNMYTGLMSVYISEFTDNVQLIGFMMSLINILAFTALIGGALSSRIHTKYIIAFGWIITIPAPLLFMLANSWQMILVGQILHWITSISASCFMLYIFDYPCKGDKMNAYMLCSIGVMIGAMIAPSIGGIIADRFGMRVLFAVVLVLYILSSVCTCLLTPYKRENAPVQTSAEGSSDDAHVGSGRTGIGGPVVLFTVLACVMHFAHSVANPVVSLYLNETRAFSVEMIGYGFTAFGIGGMLLMAFSKRYDLRIGTGKTLFILASVYICANFGMALTSAWGLLLAMTLRGAERMLPLYVQGKVAEIVTGKHKGIFLSVYMVVRCFLMALASNVGAGMYEVWTYLPFLAEIVLVAVWLAVFFILRGKFDFLVGKPKKNTEECLEKI